MYTRKALSGVPRPRTDPGDIVITYQPYGVEDYNGFIKVTLDQEFRVEPEQYSTSNVLLQVSKDHTFPVDASGLFQDAISNITALDSPCSTNLIFS